MDSHGERNDGKEEKSDSRLNGPESRNTLKKGSDINDFARYAVLTSTPYIVISYPLAGFGLGYLLVYYFKWPIWVALFTMMLGLVQGIREVIKLGNEVDKSN